MELLGMSILILLVILIKEDLLQGMFLLLVVMLSIGNLLCRLRLLYLLLSKEVIWLKGLFGELSDNLQITIVFVIVRVLFSSQKIKCFMREQRTLMCGITL